MMPVERSYCRLMLVDAGGALLLPVDARGALPKR